MKTMGVIYSIIIMVLASVLIYSLLSSAPMTDSPKTALESQNQQIHIAVVESSSGTDARTYGPIRKAVDLAVERINQKGGIDGRQMALHFYDDQSDIDLALAIASEITSNNKVLAVLGHQNNDTATAANLIYQRAEIPAIVAFLVSAGVTLNNDWCFRITPSYASWGDFSANYIKKAFKQSAASIIYTRNQLGFEMVKQFEDTAQLIGLEIIKEWGIETEHYRIFDDMAPVLDTLKSGFGPGAIFIAAHKKDALEIIKLLKTLKARYSILSVDSSYLGDIYTNHDQAPKNEASLVDMEGVYMVTPFLAGIANKKAQTFQKDYWRKYGENPSALSATYYDAIMMIAEAAKKAKLQGRRQIRRHRRMVRAALVSMYNKTNAAQGVTGNLFFNKNGDVGAPLAVGVYEDLNFVPAFDQFHFMTDFEATDNLLEMYLKEQIIIVNNQVMAPTQVVRTGLKINRISNLDIENSTYTIEFLLSFRFKDSFDPSGIVFSHAINPIKFAEPMIEKKVGNSQTRIYRLKGTFKSAFDFHQYPFNSPVLSIAFHHAVRGRHSLILMQDELASAGWPEEENSREINMDAPGQWKIKAVSTYQDIIGNASSLGIPTLFDAQTAKQIDYSRFNTAIVLTRPAYNPVSQKYFAPIVTMLIGLLLTFFKPVRLCWLRVPAILLVLVVNSYYYMEFSKNLPVEYITRLDYTFWAIYTLAFISMLFLIFQSTLGAKKQAN